jgi:subtilisin family serine protease
MIKFFRILILILVAQFTASAAGFAGTARVAWFDEENDRPRLRAQAVPNDPYFRTADSWGQGFDDLWGVKRIRADRAWDSYRGAGVRIAVIDSGVLWHEDISGNIWENSREITGRAGFDDDGNGYVDDIRGWDFVSNDNVATDENGHGTHVGGIAAGTGFNSRGISGVAPAAKIMRIRALNAAGDGTVGAIANSIRYAAKNGAKVINMSFGGIVSASAKSLLQSAVNYAHSLGSIMVAAMGNYGADGDNFGPANLDYVLGIGATDYTDTRAGFSNYGSKMDFMAPGVDILSLGSPSIHIGGAASPNYYYASGTSMAAPFVSGAIALLLNKYPTANVFDIKKYLINGAVDLGAKGWDPYYGYGRIDIARSLGMGAGTATSFSGQTSQSTPKSTNGTSASGVTAAVINEITDKHDVAAQAAAQRSPGGSPLLKREKSCKTYAG